MSKYPRSLERLMGELQYLPSVGPKTAARLAFHLLEAPLERVQALAQALKEVKERLTSCRRCGNLAEGELCPICQDPDREPQTLCLVANTRELMAMENSGQYRGLYHVLGGVISPIDGIGPGDLQIESLVQRVNSGGVSEVILALSTTMEGDSTNFYIYRKLAPTGVRLSVIARGIAVGDELEYADEVTLGRSIVNRTPFQGNL